MGLMPTKTNVPPQEAAPEEGRYTDEQDSDVSPEEQAQYSKFEENYMRAIYTKDGDVNPAVLDALQSQAELPEGAQGEATPPHIAALASAAVTIIEKLDDSAREAGDPLTDDVLTQGGVAVLEELAEVAEAAGIHDYSEDELQGALTVALDMYREKAIADGRTDEETLKGQWGELVQADQEGRAGEMVPGLEG